MKNFDFQEFALRALIVLAGGVAAALFILKGQTSALPALALGATLGVCVMTRYGQSAE
jgi:uncharacterized membrane protein YccC